MEEQRQEVPWAEGLEAVGRIAAALRHLRIAAEMARVSEEGARVELGIIAKRPDGGGRITATFQTDGFLADLDAMVAREKCRECFKVGAHAPDCARGKRIAENLARGVWPWLVPFVMPDPPPKTDLEVDVFQVYPQGLDAMIDVSNPGHPADWRVNASDPDDDLPGQFALGWVALGPEGPTLAPWGL